MSHYFADRLGNISVLGGVARLDFLTVKEIDKTSQKVSLENSIKLVMPLEGIMQTIDALEKMKQELLEVAEKESKEAKKI
ncbi:hypothetical protein QJU23_08975 [Pasteurella atlantica]|uniref:Uncharacterized protein n=2 Tax=Pasteurellaceae TaxID=712 RepID=A0ACC6HP36_9PAST|nr:hypothetical protein [Pasteurella atlantica]MDP8052553.1 hypothetical protein [Pasteurella atlantica]MDP8102016.1 hypothetical protein [Pasteurella atlantica]MDP8105624.1 hypothetical protein [Pasteurella atlantica]MDP8148956.1 hypothetical protein [Pasteurella atlantica]